MSKISLLEYIDHQTFEEVKSLLKKKLISVNESDRFPNLYCASYRGVAGFDDPVVQQCRGIILEKETNRILCYPFNKFFNENEAFSSAIDYSNFNVYEKLDGSIMKLFFYNDQWILSTNKCVDARSAISDCGKSFYELFFSCFDNFNFDGFNTHYTYIFELCHPLGGSVVRHSIPKIYLIGLRNILTYEEMNIECFADFASKKGFCLPEKFQLKSKIDCFEALKSYADPRSFEGFVIVDHKFNRVKLKTQEYIRLHHFLDGEPWRQALTTIFNNEIDEVLVYCPQLTEIIRETHSLHLNFVSKLKNFLVNNSNSDRKSFALNVMNCFDKNVISILMKLFGQKDSLDVSLLHLRINELIAEKFFCKNHIETYYQILKK